MSHLHVTMTANAYKYWHILATVLGSQRFADNKTSSKITNSMRHLHGSHRYRLMDFGNGVGKIRIGAFWQLLWDANVEKRLVQFDHDLQLIGP